MISQWPWSETFGIINRKKLGHIFIDILSKKQLKLGSFVWNKAVRTVAPVVFWKVGQFEIFSLNNWIRQQHSVSLRPSSGHRSHTRTRWTVKTWKMKTLCPTSPSEPGQRGSQAGESDEKGRDVFQVVHISRQRLPPLHGTGGHWRGFANNDFSRGDIYWNKNNHICSVTQATQQVISEINSNARRVIHRYSVYTWRHAKPLQSN